MSLFAAMDGLSRKQLLLAQLALLLPFSWLTSFRQISSVSDTAAKTVVLNNPPPVVVANNNRTEKKKANGPKRPTSMKELKENQKPFGGGGGGDRGGERRAEFRDKMQDQVSFLQARKERRNNQNNNNNNNRRNNNNNGQMRRRKLPSPPPLQRPPRTITTPPPQTGTFVPGSLSNRTRLQALAQCYSHPQRYQGHFKYYHPADSSRRERSFCSVSDKYRVVYVQVEKAGSSTNRLVLQHDFGAREIKGCLYWNATVTLDDGGPQQQPPHSVIDHNDDPFVNEDQMMRRRIRRHEMAFVDKVILQPPQEAGSEQQLPWHYFTAVREPSSRFFSGFQEMLKRLLLAPSNRRVAVPPQYDAFTRDLLPLSRAERFHFLSGRDEAPLQRALERFVHDYDGVLPWDSHLRLQVAGLSHDETGLAFQHFGQLMETATLEAELQRLSRERRDGNATLSVQGAAYARKTRESAWLDSISDWTRRKICQLMALDYCCLNYPLPAVCAGAVECQWVPNPYQDYDNSEDWLIEAVSPFPRRPPPPTDAT